MASKAHEAAAAAVHEMLAAESAEASAEETEPVSSPEDTAAAEEEPQEADETPEFDFDPEVPDDIRALVDEPDFEEEAEAEIAAQAEEWDEEGEEEYVDPRLMEERKQRIALEKKLAHVETLRIKDARKAWAEEAEKFYPLADSSKIEATSRRGFLREAKKAHDANKPFVLKGIERTKAELAAKYEQEYAAKVAELEAAWGRPITGAGQVVEAAPEKAKKIDDAFKKNFQQGVREMLRQEV